VRVRVTRGTICKLNPFIDVIQFVSDAAPTKHEHSAVGTPNAARKLDDAAVSTDVQPRTTPNSNNTLSIEANLQDSANENVSPNNDESASGELRVEGEIGDPLSIDEVNITPDSTALEQAASHPNDTALVSQYQAFDDEPTQGWQLDDAATIESQEARFEFSAINENATSFRFGARSEIPQERTQMGPRRQTANYVVQRKQQIDHLMLAWPKTLSGSQNEYSLELLRCYRYEIAPWVSANRICSPHVD